MTDRTLTYLAPILTRWQINSAREKKKQKRRDRPLVSAPDCDALLSITCSQKCAHSLFPLLSLCLLFAAGPRCKDFLDHNAFFFFSLSPLSTQMSYQHSGEDAVYHNFFIFFLREDIWYTWELSQLTEWSVYSESICILIVCEQGECESSEGFGRKDMIAFMSHQAACWIQGNA